MGKLRIILAGVLVLLGAAAHSTAADAATGQRHRVNLAAKNAPEYSINWSGYAVEAKAGEQITAVSGAWHVPKIEPAPPGFSSSWIGIGGYRTGDLIQVGTASSGRIDGNYAWYEMLPDFAIPITSGCAGDGSCAVARGDRMSVSVTNVGGDTWVLAMANLGKGPTAKWHWAMTVPYKSTLSSAEFIFEAPQIGALGVGGIQTVPANAPSAKFLGGTLRLNGVTKPLAASSPVRIIMVDPIFGLVRTGTPSLMAPDGHFAVCAYKSTCPNF